MRLKNERLARWNKNRPHQPLNRRLFANIDQSVLAMLEHAELMPQPEIDRAASKLLRRQRRRDLDFVFCYIPLDIDVRKDHYLVYLSIQAMMCSIFSM